MKTTCDADLAELHALLDEGRAHDAEYGGGLANHLPMVLHALHSIGATPARLRSYARMYAERLVHVGDEAEATLRSPWPSVLGQSGAFVALRESFAAAIARDGMARTLAQALPTLMPGVAAGAFHGLLRTAHGGAAAHPGEIASGLAYWASAYLPLVALIPSAAGVARAAGVGAGLPPHEWAAALMTRPAPPGFDAPLIAWRMSAWARAPGFAEAATALRIDASRPIDTLDALARLAARLYAETRNFTVLHLVTSCHAMRVLSPWQPDPAKAVRAYATAVAAGLCAARLDARAPTADPPSPMRWNDIIRLAIASDDDHLAKLVHACRSLETELGDDAFRLAAARAIDGLSRPAGRSRLQTQNAQPAVKETRK